MYNGNILVLIVYYVYDTVHCNVISFPQGLRLRNVTYHVSTTRKVNTGDVHVIVMAQILSSGINATVRLNTVR